MRLFAAVPLEEQMRFSLYRGLAECRDSCRDIKWVKPEAMHITLVFLGEVPDEDAGDIHLAIREAALDTGPFTLQFEGFGWFPPAGSPRVFFCRITEGAENLEALHGSLSSALSGRRTPFTPHLTVGRVRRNSRPKGVPGRMPVFSGSSRVDRVVLYRSVLKSGGPEYFEELVRFLA